MNNIIKWVLLIGLLLSLTSCEKDKFEVMYSVTSRENVFPAKIIFLNNQAKEQSLPEEILPWSYKFTGTEGDNFKVSANVFSNGGAALIGTDTLKIIIYVNGCKYKETTGVISSTGSDIITVSGKR